MSQSDQAVGAAEVQLDFTATVLLLQITGAEGQ